MKKLLSILFVFTLIACGGGSDDDESMGRTTDPLIGSWSITPFDGEHSLVINANGSLTVRFVEEGEESVNTGTWSNNGSDYDASVQIYTVIVDDGEEEITTNRYNEDFSEFVSDGLTYVRQ